MYHSGDRATDWGRVQLRVVFKADKVKKLAEEYAKVKVGGLINRTLRQLYRLLEPVLKAETPVRTGRLRASTRGQVLYDGTNQVLSVRQGAMTKEGAFYGRFVREGTEPHIIRPRRQGGVLAFQYKGEMVFARSVKHPGTRANPYHIRTLDRTRPQIEALATRMMGDIVAIVHKRQV